MHFVLQPGLVTDFSQPPQLFALAINSPPARAFAGSCGGGPEGRQYRLGWLIGQKGGHVYIEPKSEEQSTLLTDESNLDSIGDTKSARSKVSTNNGLLSSASKVSGRLEPYLWSRTKTPSDKVSSTSGTEPLRHPGTNESVPTFDSQYELVDLEARD